VIALEEWLCQVSRVLVALSPAEEKLSQLRRLRRGLNGCLKLAYAEVGVELPAELAADAEEK
jgi:hypothetical protein